MKQACNLGLLDNEGKERKWSTEPKEDASVVSLAILSPKGTGEAGAVMPDLLNKP